jgi:ATP-dependent protease ClpP protease subunit
MTALVLNRRDVGVDHTIETTLTVNEGTIELYDNIVPWKYSPEDPSVTVDDITGMLNELDGDVTLRINSRGGEVGSALTIFNRVREYDKGKTTSIVDGYAFSSAGWIALACDERKICTGGIWMCHNPMMYPEVKSLSDIDKIRNQWEANYNSIVDILSTTTGLSEEVVKDMMENETFLSAKEAVEKGVFHSIHNNKADLKVLNMLPPANIPEAFNIKPMEKPKSVDISRLSLLRRQLQKKP